MIRGGVLAASRRRAAEPTVTPSFAAVSTLSGASNAAANFPVPSGVVEDDVILVHFWAGDPPGGGAPIAISAVPSGFTEAPSSPRTFSGGCQLHVYWKRQTSATGSGETTGTYNFTMAATPGWRTGFAARYIDVVTSGDPIDVDTSAAASGSTSYPNTSLTTTVDDCLLVWSTNALTASNTTPPSGFTENADDFSTVSLSIASKVQAAAGATGTLSGSQASGTSGKGVWLGALKPVGSEAAAYPSLTLYPSTTLYPMAS